MAPPWILRPKLKLRLESVTVNPLAIEKPLRKVLLALSDTRVVGPVMETFPVMVGSAERKVMP